MQMTARTIWLAAGAITVLGGCAGGGLLPSEYAYLNTTPEQAEQWIDECEGNENDAVRKLRHCELAIKWIEREAPGHPDYGFVLVSAGNLYFEQARWLDAERVYSDAIDAGEPGLGHGNRGYVYEQLGRWEEAYADFDAAYQASGDRTYLEDAVVLDYALDAARLFDVYYTGFACRAVGADSFLNPDAEIAVHVVAADATYAKATHFPQNSASYKGVRNGHVHRGQGLRVFNAIGLEPFTLSVMMWEVDNGSNAVDVAVFYGSMLAGKKAVPSTGARLGPRSAGTMRSGQADGRVAVKNPAPQYETTSPSPGPIHDAIASPLKSFFGTEPDYLGGHDFTNLIGADIMESEAKVENGIYYDFKSSHRRGGFDCSAYFVLEEFEQDEADYVDAVNWVIDGNDIRDY